MAISFEHGIDVPQAPERVFSLLDDVSKTPRWLDRCVGIENLTDGPNRVGSKLRYSFREGGHVGVMDGEIVSRSPNEHLGYVYVDKMMHVSVDFRMARAGQGTHLVHAIVITPGTFFARLLSPLIRRQLPRQTITAMEKLRVLLGSEDA